MITQINLKSFGLLALLACTTCAPASALFAPGADQDDAGPHAPPPAGTSFIRTAPAAGQDTLPMTPARVAALASLERSRQELREKEAERAEKEKEEAQKQADKEAAVIKEISELRQRQKELDAGLRQEVLNRESASTQLSESRNRLSVIQESVDDLKAQIDHETKNKEAEKTEEDRLIHQERIAQMRENLFTLILEFLTAEDAFRLERGSFERLEKRVPDMVRAIEEIQLKIWLLSLSLPSHKRTLGFNTMTED